MRSYGPDKIRNVGLFGHGGSLSEVDQLGLGLSSKDVRSLLNCLRPRGREEIFKPSDKHALTFVTPFKKVA